jgi:hypothetical protein
MSRQRKKQIKFLHIITILYHVMRKAGALDIIVRGWTF